MRVTGGTLGGRTLKGPSSQKVRPTSDRLRAALFNVLAHAYDDAANGARVIDLFERLELRERDAQTARLQRTQYRTDQYRTETTAQV